MAKKTSAMYSVELTTRLTKSCPKKLINDKWMIANSTPLAIAEYISLYLIMEVCFR